MRNRKAYEKTTAKPKAEEKTIVVKEDAGLASEVSKLRQTVEKAMSSQVVPPDFDAMFAGLEKAVQKPQKVAVEVMRDSEGRIVGMVGHTDPKAIARIERKRKSSGNLDDWVKESLN